MAGYPVSQVPNKIKTLLDRIPTMGIPSKVHLKWLASIGYKSKNDRSLPKVFNYLGFIDSSGVPTERWKSYRGRDRKTVLATAIKECYEGLYNIYPDAHCRSNDELKDYFTTKTTGSEISVQRLVPMRDPPALLGRP